MQQVAGTAFPAARRVGGERWKDCDARRAAAEIVSADIFVDFEVGLNSIVRKLRQALNDDGKVRTTSIPWPSGGIGLWRRWPTLRLYLERRTKIHHLAFGFRCPTNVRILQHPKKFSPSRGGGIGSWRRVCWRSWPTWRWQRGVERKRSRLWVPLLAVMRCSITGHATFAAVLAA